MGAVLNDTALFEHGDRVRVADRGQAVRHDHGGAVFEHAVEVALDRGLGFGVEGARGLVEQQHGRVVVEGARDADALGLPAGEAHAAVADLRVVCERHALDEARGVRDLGCALHAVHVGHLLAEGDVRRDRVVEQVRRL